MISACWRSHEARCPAQSSSLCRHQPHPPRPSDFSVNRRRRAFEFACRFPRLMRTYAAASVGFWQRLIRAATVKRYHRGTGDLDRQNLCRLHAFRCAGAKRGAEPGRKIGASDRAGVVLPVEEWSGASSSVWCGPRTQGAPVQPAARDDESIGVP
jgi:hypothetical protein